MILTEWTAVAVQPRPGAAYPSRRLVVASVHGPRWRPIPDAPLSYDQARAMVASGLLIAANRVRDYGTEYVVKSTRLALQQAQQAA